jgi:hypothetical protein
MHVFLCVNVIIISKNKHGVKLTMLSSSDLSETVKLMYTTKIFGPFEVTHNNCNWSGRASTGKVWFLFLATTMHFSHTPSKM